MRTTATAMGATPTNQFNPREKPTYVPQTNDPLGFSIADNLFWNDIMMEHAMFFVMLMPGPENAALRSQAEEFQRLFTRQLEMSRTIAPDNFMAFNRASIDMARRFDDWKENMREQQGERGATMGEHSGFIAHLLDPDEKLLIEQASRLERTFRQTGPRNVPGDDIMKAAQEVLDFKTVGGKGSYEGKIKSIIPPPLASHVRREAVRFIDELKRTQAG